MGLAQKAGPAGLEVEDGKPAGLADGLHIGPQLLNRTFVRIVTIVPGRGRRHGGNDLKRRHGGCVRGELLVLAHQIIDPFHRLLRRLLSHDPQGRPGGVTVEGNNTPAWEYQPGFTARHRAGIRKLQAGSKVGLRPEVGAEGIVGGGFLRHEAHAGAGVGGGEPLNGEAARHGRQHAGGIGGVGDQGDRGVAAGGVAVQQLGHGGASGSRGGLGGSGCARRARGARGCGCAGRAWCRRRAGVRVRHSLFFGLQPLDFGGDGIGVGAVINEQGRLQFFGFLCTGARICFRGHHDGVGLIHEFLHGGNPGVVGGDQLRRWGCFGGGWTVCGAGGIGRRGDIGGV